MGDGNHKAGVGDPHFLPCSQVWPWELNRTFPGPQPTFLKHKNNNH